MEVYVGSDAEYPPAAPALHFLVVIGEVYPDEAEAQIGPEHVAELGAVPGAAHTTIPDARGEIRLDADPRRRERHPESHGARYGGLRRPRICRIRPRRASPS